MVNHSCCVKNCKVTSDKVRQTHKYPHLSNVTFHPFPRAKDVKRRKLWISLVKKPGLTLRSITKYTRICSTHWIGLGPTTEEPDPSVFHHDTGSGRQSSLSHFEKRMAVAKAATDVICVSGPVQQEGDVVTMDVTDKSSSTNCKFVE